MLCYDVYGPIVQVRSHDQTDVDVLIHDSRSIDRVVAVGIGTTAVLATYLVQRSLEGIAWAGPHVMLWSRDIQICIVGLRFSYVTMTLAWPLVLAALCFGCRMAVSRKLILLSFLTTEWKATTQKRSLYSADRLLGSELAAPFARYVWSALAVLPMVTIGMHFLSGIASLALLHRARTWASTGDLWPIDRLVPAFVILSLSCACGLWSATRFFSVLLKLREGLVECSQLPAHAGPHEPEGRRRHIAVAAAPLHGAGAPPDWDIFISAKKLARDGATSRDSVIAEELYEFLEGKGYRVFFSSRSLEATGASAYKIAIDRALDQCTVLIAVGTTAANLDSGWVRYEWDSFLNDILSGIKPHGRVFVYLEGVEIKELCRPLRQSQVFEHGGPDMERLSVFIQNASHEIEGAASKGVLR